MRVPAIYFWTWIFIAFIWLYLKPKRILDRLWRNTLSIHSGKRTNYVTWSLFLEINFYSILRFTRTIDLVKGVGWSSTYDVFFSVMKIIPFKQKFSFTPLEKWLLWNHIWQAPFAFLKEEPKTIFYWKLWIPTLLLLSATHLKTYVDSSHIHHCQCLCLSLRLQISFTFTGIEFLRWGKH